MTPPNADGQARVRVGVIGTSEFVARVHLPLLRSHPRAEVAALCGRTLERTADVARRFGIPGVFRNYEDLIDSGVDAVVVATPDDLHAVMTLAALDAGLHVLCEKPMARTESDARAMLDRARARAVKHMVFFRWRWLPAYERLRELALKRWVGKPLQWTFQYLSSGGWRPGYQWRFDERRGTGALGDLGSHMIDLAIWAGGPVAAVSARLQTFRMRVDEDGSVLQGNDAAVLLLHFADGAQGTVQVSSVAALGPETQLQRVAVYGDDGFLEVVFSRASGAVLRGARGAEPVTTFDLSHDRGSGGATFDDQLLADWCQRSVGDRLFIDAIVENGQPVPSFLDGVRVQAVIAAALESSASGSCVDVAHVD